MSLAVMLAIALALPDKPKDGHAVMDEVDKRRRTASEYSEGVITVEEKGKTKQKAWRSWRLGWGPEAKGLIQFQEPAEVKGVAVVSTRMCTWRQMKRRPVLRISAPGRSPASQRIWKPLQMPRTRPPDCANFATARITGENRAMAPVRR